jgi:hypothetical protein
MLAAGRLDASRLPLQGKFAHWPLADWLPDEMAMAFREPRVLHQPGRDPSEWEWPGSGSSTKKEWIDLYEVLSSVGLLRVVRGERLPHETCAVFNLRKDAVKDRMVVDSRGPNGSEGRLVAAASSSLFPAYRLTEVVLKKKVEFFRASGTDRRDFYYQCQVTDARTATNALGPAWCEEDLWMFRPLLEAVFEQEHADRKLGREAAGDRFLRTSPPSEAHRRQDRFHLCLASEAMGDHAGVEFCQAGHFARLRAEGLLSDQSWCDGRRPVPRGELLELLCIDDYISAKKATWHEIQTETGADLASYDRALAAYAADELGGSLAKDWRGRLTWQALGAEVDSSPPWVARGYVSVGAPRARRLALSYISLRAARLPVLAGRLGATLASSWTWAYNFQRPLMVVLDQAFGFATLDETKFHPMNDTQSSEFAVAAVLAPLAETDLTAEVLDRVFAMDASPDYGAICETQVPAGAGRSLWETGEKGTLVWRRRRAVL